MTPITIENWKEFNEWRQNIVNQGHSGLPADHLFWQGATIEAMLTWLDNGKK